MFGPCFFGNKTAAFPSLRGAFKYFSWSSLFREMIQLDEHIFFRWVETTNELRFFLPKAGVKSRVAWIAEYPDTKKSGSHRGWACFTPMYHIHLPGDYKSGLEMCPRNVDICLFPGLAALIRQNCKPHVVDPMNLQAWVVFFSTALVGQQGGNPNSATDPKRSHRFFSSICWPQKKKTGGKVFPKNT